MQNWPPLAGDYKVLGEKKKVAVVTLTTSPENFALPEAAIVGSLKTENLGVERIIINTISNPAIRAFIICGEESHGHRAGQALYSAWKNGADEKMKIIGALGPIPYLENITGDAVARFKRQVAVMEDMAGEMDKEKVRAKILEIEAKELPEFSEEPMFVLGTGKKQKGKVATNAEQAEKAENMLVLPGGFLVDPLSFKIESGK